MPKVEDYSRYCRYMMVKNLEKHDRYLPVYLSTGINGVARFSNGNIGNHIDLDNPKAEIKRHVLIYGSKLETNYSIITVDDKWQYRYDDPEIPPIIIYKDKELQEPVKDEDVIGPLLCVPFIIDLNGYCSGFKIIDCPKDSHELVVNFTKNNYTDVRLDVLTFAINDLSDTMPYSVSRFTSSLCIQIIRLDNIIFCLGFRTFIKPESHISCLASMFMDIENNRVRYDYKTGISPNDFVRDFIRELTQNPRLMPSISFSEIKDYVWDVIETMDLIFVYKLRVGCTWYSNRNLVFKFIAVLLKRFGIFHDIGDLLRSYPKSKDAEFGHYEIDIFTTERNSLANFLEIFRIA